MGNSTPLYPSSPAGTPVRRSHSEPNLTLYFHGKAPNDQWVNNSQRAIQSEQWRLAARTGESLPGLLPISKPAAAAPPAANPSVPTQTPSKIATAANWVTGQLLQIGKGEIEKTRMMGTLIPIKPGTVFAPYLTIQPYFPENDAIRNDANRNWFVKGPHVTRPMWIKLGGIIEMGTSGEGTLPIAGGLGSVGAGFGASGLLQYESMLPYDVSVLSTVQDTVRANVMKLPTSAENARAMPVGGEYLLRGHGEVTGHVSVATGSTAGLNGNSASLSAGLTIGAKYTGELCLKILRLKDEYVDVYDDQQRVIGQKVLQKVRVTISQLDTSSRNLSAELRAGARVDASGAVSLPGVGSGFLKALLEKQGVGRAEKLVNKYSDGRITFTEAVNTAKRDLDCFEFELNHHPMAAKAFEKIVPPGGFLNVAEAERLASAARSGFDSGVTQTSLDTHQVDHATALEVQMLGAKILLFNTLQSDLKGVFTDVDGGRVRYRNVDTGTYYGDYFSGKESTCWQGRQVLDKNGQVQSFFKMTAAINDYNTSPHEVARFFRFMTAMGDKNAAAHYDSLEPALKQLSRTNQLTRTFSRTDNTRRNFTCFLTSPGVSLLAASTPEQIRDGFLRGYSKVNESFEDSPMLASDAEVRGTAIAAAQKINEIHNSWWCTASMQAQAFRLREQYAIAYGRNLDTDAKVLKEANRFCTHIAQLKTAMNQSSIDKQFKKVADFFRSLGDDYGLQYMEPLAAINEIVGPDAIAVTEIGISGAGLNYSGQTEDPVIDPTATMLQRAMREA